MELKDSEKYVSIIAADVEKVSETRCLHQRSSLTGSFTVADIGRRGPASCRFSEQRS
jgi:hypothetical protein